MICLDTSVVVAAFSSWHDDHAAALALALERPSIVSHCVVEAYSVLTRMPAPFRAPGDVVAEYLSRQFADRIVHPPRSVVEWLPGQLARLGIVGGSAYDALIGETARQAEAELVTLDQRAIRTYRALEAPYRLLASV